LEVVATRRADPAIPILGAPSLMEGSRLGHHELVRAELAMIVVVLMILRRVRTPYQRDTGEVTLLVGKSPIVRYAHFRRLTSEMTGGQ
jgi:hypothetical protein